MFIFVHTTSLIRTYQLISTCKIGNVDRSKTLVSGFPAFAAAGEEFQFSMITYDIYDNIYDRELRLKFRFVSKNDVFGSGVDESIEDSSDLRMLRVDYKDNGEYLISVILTKAETKYVYIIDASDEANSSGADDGDNSDTRNTTGSTESPDLLMGSSGYLLTISPNVLHGSTSYVITATAATAGLLTDIVVGLYDTWNNPLEAEASSFTFSLNIEGNGDVPLSAKSPPVYKGSGLYQLYFTPMRSNSNPQAALRLTLRVDTTNELISFIQIVPTALSVNNSYVVWRSPSPSIAGSTVVFEIHTQDTLGNSWFDNRFLSANIWLNGEIYDRAITSDTNPNGVYTVSYTPTRVGTYSFSISFDGERIDTAVLGLEPVVIEAGDLDVTQTTYDFEGLSRYLIEAGDTSQSFRIILKDKFRNTITKGSHSVRVAWFETSKPMSCVDDTGNDGVVIGDGDGDEGWTGIETCPRCYVLDWNFEAQTTTPPPLINSDGSYTVVVGGNTVSGTYLLYVIADDCLVSCCEDAVGRTIIILPSAFSPEDSKTTLIATEGEAGEIVSFSVISSDQYGNAVKESGHQVSIVREDDNNVNVSSVCLGEAKLVRFESDICIGQQSMYDVQCKQYTAYQSCTAKQECAWQGVVETFDGVHEVAFRLERQDRYLILIAVDDVYLRGALLKDSCSLYEVFPSAPFTFAVDTLNDAYTAGTDNTFIIRAQDRFGNTLSTSASASVSRAAALAETASSYSFLSRLTRVERDRVSFYQISAVSSRHSQTSDHSVSFQPAWGGRYRIDTSIIFADEYIDPKTKSVYAEFSPNTTTDTRYVTFGPVKSCTEGCTINNACSSAFSTLVISDTEDISPSEFECSADARILSGIDASTAVSAQYCCSDGSCVANPMFCPSFPTCNTADKYQCPDSLFCVDTFNSCSQHQYMQDRYNDRYQQVKCPLGFSGYNSSFCPTPITCTEEAPVLCADSLQCVKASSDCDDSIGFSSCPSHAPYRCPGNFKLHKLRRCI